MDTNAPAANVPSPYSLAREILLKVRGKLAHEAERAQGSAERAHPVYAHERHVGAARHMDAALGLLDEEIKNLRK